MSRRAVHSRALRPITLGATVPSYHFDLSFWDNAKLSMWRRLIAKITLLQVTSVLPAPRQHRRSPSASKSPTYWAANREGPRKARIRVYLGQASRRKPSKSSDCDPACGRDFGQKARTGTGIGPQNRPKKLGLGSGMGRDNQGSYWNLAIADLDADGTT